MQPFFSVTLFTGQQLILEAIQRWLQRPCTDEIAVQQRRLGLKVLACGCGCAASLSRTPDSLGLPRPDGPYRLIPAPSAALLLPPQGLISLLLRTAATGVLATLLDAAIEFRRRQLLAAAAADEGGAAGGDGAPSRFPGLGMLSRAGVAAWKARLLVAIDELERRAEACGIGAWAAGSNTMPRCQAQDASSFASLLLPACSSPALFDCAAAMHCLTANATLPIRLHLPQTRPRSPRPPLPVSRRRFSPGKDAQDELAAAEGGKPATGGGLRSHPPSAACLAPGEEEEEEESQSQRLGRTVEQLRELVQQGGELRDEWG